MAEKCKCIICGGCLEGTEEHIIPKSLGNHCLKTWSVCKQCNSGLGTYVDNHLVNNMFIQIIRQNLQLKGQSGQVPNPFKEGKDKDGKIFRVNDKFEPTTVPTVETADGRLRITAPTKEEAKKIATKKLQRLGMPEGEIQKALGRIESQEPVMFQPEIGYDAPVDFNLLFLAALKIAYEYSCYKLGDEYCWEDSTAKDIREILYNGSKGNYDKKYEKVMLMPSEIAESIKPAAHLNGHLLYIHPAVANQLIVEIMLFMSPAFSFSVCVSEKADKYQKLLENKDTEIIDICN